MRIRRIFNEPHPLGIDWNYAIIPALIVFFILAVLAPYGFSKLSILDRLARAFPFVIITGLSTPLNFLIAKFLFPRALDDSKWTIARELIFNLYDIILIGFWNSSFLFLFIETNDQFFELLARMELHTLAIGIIPMVALIG